MARITIEDSLEKVSNRFDLILIASRRARDLSLTGQDPLVSWNNDKPTVVALREIAAGKIGPEILNIQPEVFAADAFDFTNQGKNLKDKRKVFALDDLDDDDEDASFNVQLMAAAAKGGLEVTDDTDETDEVNADPDEEADDR